MNNFDDLFAPPTQVSPARSSSVTPDLSSDPLPAVSSSVTPMMPTLTPDAPWDPSSEQQSSEQQVESPEPIPLEPQAGNRPQRRGGIVDQIVAGVVDQLRPLLEQASTSAQDPDPDQTSLASEAPEAQVNHLQAQLDLMQLRQEKLHRQVVNYEAEIDQLHKEKRLLEQTIAELPEIYQLKFQARLEPIRHRIHQIQTENHQLRSEVYELSYQLHRPSRTSPRRWPLRLPQFSHRESPPLTALPRPTDDPDSPSYLE